MLPKELDLKYIDSGIKELVITLNRIPEVNKKTTIYGPTSCEGHIWEYEGSPEATKDGWVYFYKPSIERTGLIRRINQFCGEFPYFHMSSKIMGDFDFAPLGLNPAEEPRSRFYSLEGSFWFDEGYDDIFRQLEGDKRLIEKAQARKEELLSGWKELDSRIKDYIAKNITKDIESLPYISSEEGINIRPSCPHHF